MKVKLAYGKEGLWVELPDDNVTVVEPRFVPGLPGERSVLGNHDAGMIGHPKATWGVTEACPELGRRGNPIWEEMWEMAAKTEPTFLLNVTLNKNKEITGVFAGDVWQAHAAGTAFARESVMVPVLKKCSPTLNIGKPPTLFVGGFLYDCLHRLGMALYRGPHSAGFTTILSKATWRSEASWDSIENPISPSA